MKPKTKGRMTMREWKKIKGSSTPGKVKGEWCQASPLRRYVMKAGRGYKHSQYGFWCEKFNIINNFK